MPSYDLTLPDRMTQPLRETLEANRSTLTALGEDDRDAVFRMMADSFLAADPTTPPHSPADGCEAGDCYNCHIGAGLASELEHHYSFPSAIASGLDRAEATTPSGAANE